MSLAYPKDTLAYHLSRPFTQHRNMSAVPCSKVAEAIKAYDETPHGFASPDHDAVEFYAMNHYMALIRQEFDLLEPLPPEVLAIVERYYTVMNEKAQRAFYYLLLICIREFRHNKSLSKDGKKIGEQFGGAVNSFFQSINGGEPAIHQAFLSQTPDATIGNFVNAMQWGFYNCSWNSSYGGPAWGKCNDCLSMFVDGTLSAETMLDTNWTLAHNNGPIFNKGIYYTGYSHVLKRLLDVQRSGQVPEALVSDVEIKGVVIGKELFQLDQQVRKIFPGKLGEYVDWYLVEALGGIQEYHHDKEQQKKKHGLSPMASKLELMKAAALKAHEEKVAAEKALKFANSFEIMPGTVVPKFKMQRAA